MINRKLKTVFYLIFSAFFILTFSSLVVANIMDSIGTGSSGSYDHSADKHKKISTKKEGSGSKAYSKHKSYSHKKEGSGSKYSHHKKQEHGSHAKCQFTHLLQFKQQLGLTGAQVSTIKEMRFEYQKKRIHFKAEKQIAKMEIDKLLHAGTMDESAIRAAGDKLINLKAKMIRTKIESKISLLKLLTEDQKRLSSQLYSTH